MRALISAGLVMGLILTGIMPASAYENGDLQLWNTDSIEARLNENLKVKVEEELRFGGDISELYYTHTDGGFTLKVNGNLDLGLFYRLIYEKKKGKWKEENRPHADATLKWDLSGFKLSDRNRLEYRDFEDEDCKWQYRNKLTAQFPWKWTESDIQPYLADEIFVDFQGEKFYRNRFYAGFTMKIIKYLKADIYYLLQNSEKKDKWTGYNVIGIKLTAIF
ncbi:MAG: DUF2490 domain-containing protein [Candidatus Omnitrophota bacterium]